MMGILGGIFKVLTGGLLGGVFGAATKALGLLKKKKEPVLTQPTRNQAAIDAETNDLLAKRRGMAGTGLLGSLGAEASGVGSSGAGAKLLLGA